MSERSRSGRDPASASGGPAAAASTKETPGEGQPWTVLRLVRWSAGYLKEKGVDDSQARLDSEHLLAHALGTGRLQLYLQFERPLTPEELARYKPLLLRRAAREPLQYILGRGAFRELDLRVDPRVLIPRPETEELVEAVLEWARSRTGIDRQPPLHGSVSGQVLPWSADDAESDAGDTPEGAAEGQELNARMDAAAGTEGEAGEGAGSTGRSGDAIRRRVGGRRAGPPQELRRLTALDVGTGSGCIALSLALEGPFRRVVGSDPSAGALELARENAREAGLAERVEFRQGGLFDPVAGERFDVVVSNPPYVGEEEAGDLQPEIREHEPGAALFAGPGGLRVLEPLVEGAPPRVVPEGLLALEVGLGQAPSVADMIRVTGAFREPRIRRDLTGRPRIVLAVRKS